MGKKKRAVGKVVKFPRLNRAWNAAQNANSVAGWQGVARPIDTDIRYNLPGLRARSRDMAQNSDHVRNYLSMVKRNVIGSNGIKFQSRAVMKSGKPDKRAAAAIEDAWRQWGKKGICDVTGVYSWRLLQANLAETAAKDGEVFIRLVKGRPGDRYGIAVQLIDPEAIDVAYNDTLGGGRQIRMGIELDEWRRPVAYYINPESTSVYNASYKVTTTVGKRVRVPADEIIHAYLPEWVWQTRGVPWMATPLRRLKILDGYEEAAVIAARNSASKMAFYQQDPEATPPTGEEDIDGMLVQDAEPGLMELLPPGVTVETVDWGWPNADHGGFEKAVLRNIASGLGVNYNTLANDLEGVNYSSLRHGQLNERDTWRMLQNWFIESICEPLYDAWLECALMYDAIRLPNGAPVDVGRVDSFRRSTWQPRGWQWVDPLKDGQAAALAVQQKTRSISSIIRERGDDPEEVWQELADDLAKLDEMGLSISAASMPATDETETDTETDNEAMPNDE